MPYLFRLVDAATVCLSGWLAIQVRTVVEGPMMVNDWSSYGIIVGAAAFVYVISWGDLYRSWRGASIWLMLRGIGLRWATVSGLILLGLFIFKSADEISRLWFLIWTFMGLMLLFIERILVYQFLRFLRRIGYNYRRVVVVGSGEVAIQLLERIKNSAWSGYEIAQHIQTVDTLALESLEKASVDEIWLALPLADEELIKTTLRSLRHSAASVRFVPDLFALDLVNHGYSDVLGMPMIDMTVSRLNGWHSFQKRAMDIFISVVALLIFSPAMLALAILIKMDSPGPIFFKQKRHGVSGKIIEVYKFRSMRLHQDDAVIKQATIADPRVTPIGSFMRRTSLDEIPQFFNVLIGDMSVVGPRPHAYSHNEYYKDLIESYMKRHLMKPGITGWAQVNGCRGETDTVEKMEKRIELDLFYIENWSILIDFKIICMTFYKGFLDRNAY